MMKAEIGKKEGNNEALTIDIQKLIETKLLIQANSGGGKSYAIRKIMEETHGHIQHILLDMEGEFASLREKYDYILIGEEGDIPINIKIASTLARKLLETNANAIIDLYELKAHERKIFVKRFLDSLVNAPKKLWHPVLIVLDEMHVFAPEKSKSEAKPSVIDIASRGRKRGQCLIGATQRPAKLDKDVAAECNNKLSGRVGIDIDMKRAAEDLGITNKTERLKLRRLSPGEFHCYGPAFNTEGVEKVKIDKVETKHVKIIGGDFEVAKPTPSKEMKIILSKLSDLSNQADKELQELDDYKEEVKQLRRKVTLLKKDPTIKQKRVGQKESFQEGYDKGFKEGKEVAPVKVVEKDNSLGILRELEKIIVKYKGVVPKTSSKSSAQSSVREHTEPSEIEEDVSVSDLRAGARRMVKAVASFDPKPITKQQMATVASLSIKSGTFGTYLREIKRFGFVEETPEGYVCTPEGLQEAGDVNKVPTDPESLLVMWKDKFRAGAARMLQVVYDSYPDFVSREELGLRADISPSSGTFGTYLRELRRNGLVKVNGSNVRLSNEIMKGEEDLKTR